MQSTINEPDKQVEPDWIGLWAAPLRDQALTLKVPASKKLPEHVAYMANIVLKDRKTGLSCSETDVLRWLNGEDVPEQEAVRDALLMGLGLRYTTRINGHRMILRERVAGGHDEMDPPKVTDEIEALAAKRELSNAHYENAVLEALTRDETSPQPSQRKKPSNMICGPGKISAELNAYQKLFEHKKRKSVEDFSRFTPAQHSGFLTTTEDPAEFFACWYAMMNHQRGFGTRDEFADFLGISDTSIYDYTVGRSMPSGSTLHSIERRMPPEIYAAYQTLIIRTRSMIANAYEQNGELPSVAAEMNNMPREAYRNAIDELFGGPACARPIQTQGEYLHAIRYAFGKPLTGSLTKEKCAELGLPSPDRVANAESNQAGAETARQELANYYEMLQQERLEGIDRFVHYNNKPPLDWKFFDSTVLYCLPETRGQSTSLIATIIADRQPGVAKADKPHPTLRQ